MDETPRLRKYGSDGSEKQRGKQRVFRASQHRVVQGITVEVVKRDAGRGGEVERIDGSRTSGCARACPPVASVSADSPVLSLPDEQRQSLMRLSARARGEIDRVLARRQRHEGEPFTLQCAQGRAANRACARTDVRSTLPIDVRIALRYSGSQHVVVQNDARAKCGGVAERAADVVGIGHAFEHQQQDRRRARSSAERATGGRSASARQPRCRLKPVIAAKSSVSQT